MNTVLILEASGISVHAGSQRLLRELSFTLRAGEVLTILGESGAGKSLLADALMGNLPAGLVAGGEVCIQGQRSAARDTQARRALWGRDIGLLPQEPSLALNPVRRVGSQLEEVFRLVRGLPAHAAAEHATARLQEAGLGAASAQYSWQLSGGMAQRAVTSMALAGGASLLIADEPTKGLDAHWRTHVTESLRAVSEAGGAVLLITHDLRVAEALGGRMLVLRAGELIEAGETADILRAPSEAYTRELIAADPAHWPARQAPASGPLIVQGRGLSKAFNGKTLFHALDLDLHAGERFVVQGPSGTGKSTLGNVLLGLLRPDAGSVIRAPGLATTALQKLYQDPVASFPGRQSLGSSLRDACRLHGEAWSALQARLDSLKIDASLLTRRPSQVSGGELQRIALARVLCARPALLFADEPTSRLDPLTQRQALELLGDAMDESGAALMLVTHDEDIARVFGQRQQVFAAH
ncbi:ABC transporter ATP-binding protein [Uliginosibacterium sp. 31-12]|uniref:ABC transporter ATP-binding protein n=1 Tax=Uliginosibacterium sp. 31-12 TaxID=3062781 RepID=UPI0026E3388E|nr:ATP-binding cassette domain-containing protein [Uliginosibacterium sp. 31-12]MDO6387692.1 ATP-binding cassette domain-containing protein [Uliginosibacterium sp. 31-12]